jgi:hypothetical protein
VVCFGLSLDFEPVKNFQGTSGRIFKIAKIMNFYENNGKTGSILSEKPFGKPF